MPDTQPDPAAGADAPDLEHVHYGNAPDLERTHTPPPAGAVDPAGVAVPDTSDGPPPAGVVALAGCGICPEPVVLGELHVTVCQLTERQHDGEAFVEDARVISYFHTGCAARLAAGEAVPVPAVLADSHAVLAALYRAAGIDPVDPTGDADADAVRLIEALALRGTS